MSRENPASLFIAKTLAEDAHGLPWERLTLDQRMKWSRRASNLIIAMYTAGFTIPQPDDPDAVWNMLKEHARG